MNGDNLGMHSIHGFSESFCGQYFGRLCLTDKAEAQVIYNEDDPRVVLRDCEVYQCHCLELESGPQRSSLHGLK